MTTYGDLVEIAVGDGVDNFGVRPLDRSTSHELVHYAPKGKPGPKLVGADQFGPVAKLSAERTALPVAAAAAGLLPGAAAPPCARIVTYFTAYTEAAVVTPGVNVLLLNIGHRVNRTNEAMSKSGINVYLDWVSARRLTNWSIPGAIGDAASLINEIRLATPNIDARFYLFRKQANADLATLVHVFSDAAYALMPSPLDVGQYSTLAVTSAFDDLVIAHELGHNFGARHEW